jgi:hypothetical protein
MVRFLHQARKATTTAWLQSVQRRYGHTLLTILTSLLVVLLFILLPLQAAGLWEFRIVSAIVLLAICGCALCASGNLVAFFLLSIGVSINLVVVAMRITAPSRFDTALLAIAWLLMATTLIVVATNLVFRSSRRITYHHVIGAVLVYLLIALVFTAIFTIVGILVPGAFQGLKVEDSPALASNVVYFSFVTLTSTGFGDVVPLHPVARSLSNLETIIGQLYPATLLARLVTLELESRR